MTDSRLLKIVVGLAAGLWITLVAPISIYVAIGLHELSTDYRANAAASVEWRNDIGERIKRIEAWEDSRRK